MRDELSGSQTPISTAPDTVRSGGQAVKGQMRLWFSTGRRRRLRERRLGRGGGGAGGSRGGARFSGGGWVAVWDLLARGRLGSSFSAREQLRPWWPP